MRKIFNSIRHLFLISFLLISFTPFVFAQSIAVSNNPGITAMLQQVTPSVVNITAQGEIPRLPNPMADSGPQSGNSQAGPQQGPGSQGGQSGPQSGAPQMRQFESSGSGVIVDASNGFILTNAHVLRDAQTITVTLGDGRVFKAKLIGADLPSDIAVLQIKADKLTAAKLGNSDALKVGEFVAAIGNPFGLNQTVTSGIISALERSGLGIEGYENFVQTDASINPGNSGGALVNMQGEVIGINTAILAPSGGSIGIGLAIPSNMARSVMAQLLKYGSVNRGLIGVVVQDFTPGLASAFKQIGQVGALVGLVSPNSPAAIAGVKTGDIIQAVDGTPIKNASQLRNNIGMLRIGTSVSLKILREGKSITISLITADPQKYQMANQNINPFLYGVTLSCFDEVTAQGHLVGVQAADVSQNSMAWRAGLRTGDVILSANLKPIRNLSDLQTIAQLNQEELLLNVYRHGGAEYMVIKKPQS